MSTSNVSHTQRRRLNEVGVKYTLDDAIVPDNSINFVVAVEELLESRICEQHVYLFMSLPTTIVNQKPLL